MAEPVARSVTSALAQSEAALEVLVAAPVELALERDAEPRLRTLVIPGASRGALLRAALDASHAPYLLLLAAGDVLRPLALERLLAAIDVYPPVVVSVCRAAPAAADDAAADAPPTRAALLRTLLSAAELPPSRLLVRRDAAAAVGFDATFDASAEEDFLLRLLPRASVRAVNEELVELAPRVGSDADGAPATARGRALLRLSSAFSIEDLVVALSDGRWVPAAGARLELAAILTRSPLPEAALLARRVALEAAAFGAELPASAAFERLRERVPELARTGVPAALQQGGAPPRGDLPRALVAPEDRPPASTYPPRVRLAIAAASIPSPDARRLLAASAALRDAGLDLLVVGRDADGLDAGGVPDGIRVEVLQEPEPGAELAVLFARLQVGALLADADADRPAVAAARRAGVVVLDAIPAADDADLASLLLRTIAASAAAQSDAALPRAEQAWTERLIARAATAARQVAADGMRDPGSATGGPAARAQWSDAQRRDLIEIAHEASALATIAPSLRMRALQVLDKLRLGHRFESGLRALQRHLKGVSAARVTPLEDAPAETFLARAAADDGWLWLVYATDPYSETRGQRSAWITQELARRGHRVIYLYWRWHSSEAIPESGDANVLIVPIDQLPALQPRLLRLRAPGLRRVLLIEFPDVALYERLELFNAHGWTTVYDCVDEWEEFGRIGQAGWYDAAVERHLARAADVVVATNPLLADKLSAMAERAVPLVPNGVKLDSLHAPDEPRPPSPSAPVIGYFGHLTSSWFDWDLVRASAARNPDWRFEIYGYGQPEHLDLPPNVVAPGMLPHAELSTRTTYWSVGIVPFREGPLTQAVDPVKLYEYLALGLPVVAVGMPALREVPGVVVCDRAGFDAALRTALATPLDRERVATFVAASRWERRVDALLALIDSADRSRNPVKALAG